MESSFTDPSGAVVEGCAVFLVDKHVGNWGESEKG